MAADPLSKPSFSPRNRWGIGLNVVLIIAVLLAMVVMVNYLSQGHFLRGHWSTRTNVELSPQTINFVRSLTNDIRIVVYYDTGDQLYSTIADLLKEYQKNSSHITIQTVDCLRQSGLAEKIQADYKQYIGGGKNLILFDSGHAVKVLPGAMLAAYQGVPVIDENGPTGTFDKIPVAFNGQVAFTSALVAVTSPKSKVYFLTGHGEGRYNDAEDRIDGFQKLAGIIQSSYAEIASLSLLGTNGVPADCSLLVIPGPTSPLLDASALTNFAEAVPGSTNAPFSGESDRIEEYLNRGGRLLVLFNIRSIAAGHQTGLESLLAKWGVSVGTNQVVDPEAGHHSQNPRGEDNDVVIEQYGKHPVVDPLKNELLYMVRPRAIGRLKTAIQPASALHVDELAITGPHSYLLGNPLRRQPFSLAVAVEKGAIPGVAAQALTRIVVAGDSFFLANGTIEQLSNRDFAGYAVNWLLDRTKLLAGPGPRPLNLYQLTMTQQQQRRANFVLLAGLPGAVLLLGFLVWFRRRR